MKKKEEKNVIPFQQILVSVSVYVRKKNHNEVISMLRPKKTDNYTMFVVWIIKEMDNAHLNLISEQRR